MRGLPDAVRESVEATLRPGHAIAWFESVGGGCINNGCHLTWDDGAEHFLKWNPSVPPRMFAAESEGLAALGEAGGPGLHVPRPAGHGATAAGTWLVCEWAGPAPEEPGFQARFGEALAHLHAVPAGHVFGWDADNWIGTLPQENEPDASWPRFWRQRRLAPQLERARTRGHCLDAVFDELLERLPEALAGTGAPSLLHGDLWSGNAWAGEDGRPVVVDPAVYRGHGEVDLAMTQLFGGFEPVFYDAYAAVRPIAEAYHSHRRDVYQLYYLLVHVNLFGAGYEAGARAAAVRAVRALG